MKKPGHSGNTAGGPETKIDQATMSLGGGKNQTYIQHQRAGPGTSKRLIVAMAMKQAEGIKVTHRQVVEELLPSCKLAGATKRSVLAARAKLNKKYQK